LPGIITIIMPARDGWFPDFIEIELERTPAAGVPTWGPAGFFIAAT
jgi:hypothetical protein